MVADFQMKIDDIGKIGALHDGGWDNQKIAEEMEITPDIVEKALTYREKHPGEFQPKEELEPKPPRMVMLSEDDLNGLLEKAVGIGSREAMKKLEQERKKDVRRRADRRHHNTRLLLRNYRALKEHAESAVFSRDRLEGSAMEILETFMQGEDTDVMIDSIKRSAERTAIMISHIDAMLGLYEAFCGKSADGGIEHRRYEVLWDSYISEDCLSADEIAAKQNISKNSVYSDLRIATERMTALLFGVDGMTVH